MISIKIDVFSWLQVKSGGSSVNSFCFSAKFEEESVRLARVGPSDVQLSRISPSSLEFNGIPEIIMPLRIQQILNYAKLIILSIKTIRFHCRTRCMHNQLCCGVAGTRTCGTNREFCKSNHLLFIDGVGCRQKCGNPYSQYSRNMSTNSRTNISTTLSRKSLRITTLSQAINIEHICKADVRISLSHIFFLILLWPLGVDFWAISIYSVQSRCWRTAAWYWSFDLM